MHYALLVAWREYAENLKTRGFWFGIVLFPLIWTLAIRIPIFLGSKAVPTRHFVVVDLSGQVTPLVTNAIERAYQRELLGELVGYTRRNLVRPADRSAELDEWGKLSEVRVTKFMERGGQAAFLSEFSSGFRLNAPSFRPPPRRFQVVPLPPGIAPTRDRTLESVAHDLRPWLLGDRKLTVEGNPQPLFAALLIPVGIFDAAQLKNPVANASSDKDKKGIQFWTENLADTGLEELVRSSLTSELHRRAYQSLGMDGDKVRQIEVIQAQVNSLNPRKEAGEESVGMADRIRQWLPSVFVYLLWVAIFAIAQMLLNSVIEEKSNRIIEVLLSSVTPGELMTGKLAGIAATGLTMLAIWIGSATAIGYCFSGYFVLGYLVYATFFLALGSTCNTLKEAQNLMAMVIPILIIPLMTMPFIPRDPNGTLATVLSWIPPFTPFVMMNRVTGHPPLFDVIGTMVMLVLFVSFELWAAAKIFRIGILRTGQPPKFFEILRWFSDHS